MDINNLRQEYSSKPLQIKTIDPNPLVEFKKWFALAQERCIEANAMSLSTVSAAGMPTIRTVLLKELTEEGFIFYTNYLSNKAKDIKANNKVALLFLWLEINKQVCIQGNAYKIPEIKSQNYFKKRPRSSQIGSWASYQSSEISNRQYLKDKFNSFEQEFHNKPVEKPDFWGGYCVIPVKIEFWQGNKNRLHDRLVYSYQDNCWNIKRLAP